MGSLGRRHACLPVVLCALFGIFLFPAGVAAQKKDEGFLVYMSSEGIFKAAAQYNIHYGDSNFKLPEERMGCAIDHSSQVLFFTSPDEADPKHWLLWEFIFDPDASKPVTPIKVATLKTSRQPIRGLAVDPSTKTVYLLTEHAGRGYNVLQLPDYTQRGRTISRVDSSFSTSLDALGGEGGSLVILDRRIYVSYADKNGEKLIVSNDLDSPGAWEPLAKFSGAIPSTELLGDMVGSATLGKLYISTDSTTWMGKLYVVDVASGGTTEALDNRVQEFQSGHRPSISLMGEKRPNEYATALAEFPGLAKRYTMWVCEFKGACDGSAEYAIIPPKYGPLGPICWSDPIRERTDAPPTAVPTPAPDSTAPAGETPAPDTPEPAAGDTPTPPGDTPTPQVNETAEPGVTEAPETPAPNTPTPDAVCMVLPREECRNRLGCEWLSDVESDLLSLPVSDSTDISFVNGRCIAWGSLCGGQDERGCRILTSCFWNSGTSTCLISSYCSQREGATKCGTDPVQCKWDSKLHVCTVRIKQEEPNDDITVLLLLIALGVVACVCLIGLGIICCARRVEKTNDEMEGRGKRKKWYKEEEDDFSNDITLEETPEKTAEQAAKDADMQRHYDRVDKFDVGDVVHLQKEEVYTPQASETDSNASHHAAELDDMLISVSHGRVDVGDTDGLLLAAPRTQRELELMEKIQGKRLEIEEASRKPSSSGVRHQEERLRDGLARSFDGDGAESRAGGAGRGGGGLSGGGSSLRPIGSRNLSGQSSLDSKPTSPSLSPRKVAGTRPSEFVTQWHQDTAAKPSPLTRRQPSLHDAAENSVSDLASTRGLGETALSTSPHGSPHGSFSRHQSTRLCAELTAGLTRMKQ